MSQQEMADAINRIMQGQCSDAELALFLTALNSKGPTVEEIAGAAQAMRAHMTRIGTRRQDELLDTCGTGGDRSGTFNISTAAALVVAATGVPVAKHGNRAASSKSGSANVLAELGVNIEASVETVADCINEIGIGFCFAPLLHPSMKHVAAVRKQLGVPTIFNLLGPLCNPAQAPFQLLGVGAPPLRAKLAGALQRLGIRRALVVSGDDGLDEVTLATTTSVTEVSGAELREWKWTPADFGLRPTDLDSIRVDGPEASAAMIRDVLAAQPGPARDIVVLNAAAARLAAGRDQDPQQAAATAAAAIDDGSASALLDQLVERSSR